ncbi:MAG: hypothetical protein M1829_006370 [Trizodia sp. TS-e1964]|nr:MAG: hypothetical protein M1829_006370 [Trizodia sp. TS-e1964]
MSVRIELDKPHSHFTNLDFIAGTVYLTLNSDEAISSIVVKLEGESKTRLAPPRLVAERGDRRRHEIEVHKASNPQPKPTGSGLRCSDCSPYLPQTAVIQSRNRLPIESNSRAEHKQCWIHAKAWDTSLPFNNDCARPNSIYNALNFAGVRVDIAREPSRHVKKTLPPSLSGFPGEAEIRYYVKATVIRPQFYKENHRAQADFKFLPIEPPRPHDTKQEAYARRQHQFTAGLSSFPPKKGLFSSFHAQVIPPSGDPPRFVVDARLPNPSILTCNEPIPLRILISKLSDCTDTLFLQMLQIELIGYTNIRAHELNKTEHGSWIIRSLSNLAIPIGDAQLVVGHEVIVDGSRLWEHVPLPNTVAPSFQTCNLSRSYELEVRVGLAYGSSRNPRAEVVVLPLRMPVQVFSGVAPPAALLSAMAEARSAPQNQRVNASQLSIRPPPTSGEYPPTSISPSHPPHSGENSEDTSSNVAPPSYEDAIADELAPVDGPRRDYSQPTESSAGIRGAVDEKDTRTFGERLFPNSGPGPAPPTEIPPPEREAPAIPSTSPPSSAGYFPPNSTIPRKPTFCQSSLGETS